MADDEIEVETFDASYVKEEVVLQIRGPRGAILQFASAAEEHAKRLGKEDGMIGTVHPGRLYAGSMAAHVASVVYDSVDKAELEGIPNGILEAPIDEPDKYLDVSLEVADEECVPSDSELLREQNQID